MGPAALERRWGSSHSLPFPHGVPCQGRASLARAGLLEGRQGDGVARLLRAIQFSKIRVMGYSTVTGYQLLR
eukprot:201125-Hanusia_phi.AAC.1